jgi:hypothetical protein
MLLRATCVGTILILVGGMARGSAPPPEVDVIRKRTEDLAHMDRELRARLRRERHDQTWAPLAKAVLEEGLAKLGSRASVDCRSTICMVSFAKRATPNDMAVAETIGHRPERFSEAFYVRDVSTRLLARVWIARTGTRLFSLPTRGVGVAGPKQTPDQGIAKPEARKASAVNTRPVASQ